MHACRVSWDVHSTLSVVRWCHSGTTPAGSLPMGALATMRCLKSVNLLNNSRLMQPSPDEMDELRDALPKTNLAVAWENY